MRSLSRSVRRSRRPSLVALALGLGLALVACAPRSAPGTTPSTSPSASPSASKSAPTKRDKRGKRGKPAKDTKPAPFKIQKGIASWYGGKHHGGPTASGERFDKNALTAAHRTLKMGTRVKVTRKKNGRSVIVRINDRGPYSKGRIIDLSEAAARKLDMIKDGIAQVTIEVLE
jgi:rare lipoprotein A